MTRLNGTGLLLLLVLAGCGGGTAPSVAPASSVAAATPSPSPQAANFSQSSNVTPSGNGVALPVAGGFTASLGFSSGSLPAGVSVTAMVTNKAPSSIVPLADRRAPEAATYSSDAILYLGLTFSATTSATGALTVQTTIPSDGVPAGDVVWLALYDPTASAAGWQYGIAGPATVTSGSVSFTIPGGYPFAASQQYWFALYALPASLATPTPSTTTSALSVTPTSLSLSGTGAANAQTLAIVEPGYKGYFQVSSADTTVATLSTTVVLGPAGTVSVAPAGGGATTLTISDQKGQFVTVNVGVTAGTVIVTGGNRHD